MPHNDTFLRPWETNLLKNTVGKGEIARNEQFLLFPQCFLPVWITFFHFHQIWNCHLQTLSYPSIDRSGRIGFVLSVCNNLNIGCNFGIVSDRAFTFHMCLFFGGYQGQGQTSRSLFFERWPLWLVFLKHSLCFSSPEHNVLKESF